MTSEFFRLAEPTRLTIAQLKQGITLYDGNLQQANKKEFVAEFERARESYYEKQRAGMGLDAFCDNPKTKDLALSRHDNDLTQGAFSITGVMQNPTQNAKIAEQLREERATMDVQTSPPKKLKANIDFERTPQTIVQEEPPMFGASHYAPNEPGIRTSQFNFSEKLDENARLTAAHLGSLRERSEGLADDIAVSKLKETITRATEATRSLSESIPHMGSQESPYSGSRSASSSPVTQKRIPKDEMTVSPENPSYHSSFNVSDLGSTRTTVNKSVYNRPEKHVRYGIQKSATTHTWLAILASVGFILTVVVSVCTADVTRGKRTVPGLSKVAGLLGRSLLPLRLIQESTTLSLKPLLTCPQHAQCDNQNQVVACEKTYVLQNQPKQSSSFAWRQKLHNKAVQFNQALHKAAGIPMITDQFTKEYLAQHSKPVYFKTKQCSRVSKDQKRYIAFLREIEGQFLTLEAQRKCALIRAAVQKQTITEPAPIDDILALPPQQVPILELPSFKTKSQVGDAVRHLLKTNPEEIEAYASQSFSIQEKDDDFVASSSAELTLPLLCRAFVVYHRSKTAVIQFVLLTTLLGMASTLIVSYVRIRRIIATATIQAKQHLRNMAQHQQTGDHGSSCVNYAVRGDLLQQLTVGEYCFQKRLWSRIERKLSADCQIEKQWTRTKQGKVVEAYYYNGDGLVTIQKPTSTRDDESEHSLSY